MYYSKAEIQEHLEENWADIEHSLYPEDQIIKWADSFLPNYYSEIIKDWTEMPSEYTDSWQGDGHLVAEGIISLMTADLFNYYLDATREVYEELKLGRAA